MIEKLEELLVQVPILKMNHHKWQDKHCTCLQVYDTYIECEE